MTTYVRGSNPIWFEVDLSSNHFDDTFYMFVLQNDLPYLPATTYHGPNGEIPTTDPIRFLANGTLPVDIFFVSDPTIFYRLEFRHGPTQADPLIYLVENYQPGSGSGSVVTFELTTDNQITNPQFSLIDFSSPYTITSGSTQNLELAPGWTLLLTGTGSITVTRVPLIGTGTTINPSNAPYALRLTMVGWDTAILRQRFQQNGMLWAEKVVSSAITAKIESTSVTANISATMRDSNNTLLGTVLNNTVLTTAFDEYKGSATFPAPTDPTIPPAAYIDYLLNLNGNMDVYLTSIQLVAGDVPAFQPDFEQDSIQRQIDHTFHNYRDSILFQPKDSILSGWDFGLNPWQFTTTAATNLATFGYVADQTIVEQQAYVAGAVGNNISTARASFTQNYGFKITAVTAANQFAIIQYIDPTTARPYWGGTLSALVKLSALKQNTSANMRVKMRLMYRASLPSTLAQNEPIASWTALGSPVLTGSWTAIAPKNDPVFNLSNGVNTLTFEGFTLPASSNADMTLGIMIYTLDPMTQTGTPDNIVFNKVSLVPNEVAIDCNPLDFGETLRRCQYYYQKSFAPGTLPTVGNGTLAGYENATFGIQVSNGAGAGGPTPRFVVPLRARPDPTTGIVLYNPYTANNAIYTNTIGDWVNSAIGADSTGVNGFTTNGESPAGIGNFTLVHWTASARLGL